MADGQVVFEIEGDTRGIKDALRDTTSAIDRESRKWDNAGKNAADGIGNAFTSMFAKISAAAVAAKIGQAILQIGKDAIQAASDLEEVQNVVDVTFGKSSRQVDEWARNAIKAYGLTETQAKRYASTIGAMMKSMGVSGGAVTEMSEALAGLAADMASFYNLDFDTAFQKIRSGISGETEPLKQLGINLSVANLEAFALSQGLEKSYKQMSASEQTMLRYQYLMVATADAQGDFARTTDGLANGTRLLSSELETLKTTLGKPLADAFGLAIGVVNDFISLFMPKQKRTSILDEINEIHIDADKKRTEIKSVVEWANTLLARIEEIDRKKPPDVIGTVAEDANKLKPATASNWTTLLNGFKTANFAGIGGSTGADIASLANGLMGIDGSGYQSKKDAWQALLGVLDDNKNVIAEFTGKSPADVTNWLSGVRKEVEELSPDDVDGWTKLYNDVLSYTGGIGLTYTEQLNLGAGLGSIKSGVNGLDSTSVTNWETLLDSFDGKSFDGIKGDTGNNVKSLAQALTGNDVTKTKAQAWHDMIGAILESEQIKALPEDELQSITAELTSIGQAADELDPDNVEGWNALFARLVETVDDSGVNGEKRMIDVLSTGFDSLDQGASAAAQAMEWVSVATGATAEEQEELWASLRALTEQFPALNQFIDFNNKKIQGGVPWIEKYVESWKAMENLRIAREERRGIEGVISESMNPDEAYSKWAKARADFRASMTADLKRRGYTQAQIDAELTKWETLGAAAAYRGYTTGEVFGTRGYNSALELFNMSRANFGRSDTIADVYPRLREWYKGTGLSGGGRLKPNADGESVIANPFEGDQGNLGYWHLMLEMSYLDPVLQGKASTYLDSMAEYMSLYEAFPVAQQQAAEASDNENEALAAVNKEIEEAEEHWNELDQAQKNSIGWLRLARDEQTEAIKTTTQEFMAATAAVEEYYAAVRSGVESSVKTTVKGFAQLETQASKARKNTEIITKLREDPANKGKTDAELLEQGGGNMLSYASMKAGLESQKAYMTEYQGMLAKARELGLDPKLLASLADGSQESYDYLDALFDKNSNGEWTLASGVNIQELNDLYGEVSELREGLIDKLTQTQLEIDEEWKSLVEKVNGYIGELSQYDLAFANTDSTLKGVLDALKTEGGSLKTQVDDIENTLARLNKYGIYFGSAGDGTGRVLYSSHHPNKELLTTWEFTPHENGLDYVPYDGYLAELHKGEAVLTAQEADLFRNRGNRPGLDYDNLSGAVWDKAPNMGGDVYLDGRVVGRIISNRQADDYRAMERSGWRG